MKKSIKPKVVVVLGPTSSGKTDLAVLLARQFNGEVISADSRQVYKGMDLGSGKVTKKEMRGVPHYLLDVASPKSVFSAARYQKLAKLAVAKIIKKKKLPIVCGGTAFYIDTLMYDYKLPPVTSGISHRKKLLSKSADELYKMLGKLDPRRAKTIDRLNKRRLVRALEIIHTTGKKTPKLVKQNPYDALYIGINRPKEILKQRIHARLLKRLRQGMVREVERLHASDVSWQRFYDFGLEYRYIAMYLTGKISKEAMKENIERETWRYVKRQMTWWKRNELIYWVDRDDDALKYVENFVKN